MAGLCIVGDRLVESFSFCCCILGALLVELCDRVETLVVTLDLEESLEADDDEEED